MICPQYGYTLVANHQHLNVEPEPMPEMRCRLRLPVAYHGRSSSIVVSGTPVRRPVGQTAPTKAQQPPGFAPSAAVDFELEMASHSAIYLQSDVLIGPITG